MKKIITGFVLALVLSSFGGTMYMGFGKSLTATSTPTRISATNETSEYARHCKLVVLGSNTVYFMKDYPTNSFILTNAIPVTNGFPYEVHVAPIGLESITYATETNTSSFFLSFE